MQFVLFDGMLLDNFPLNFPIDCYGPSGVIYGLGTLVFKEVLSSVWLLRNGGAWDMRTPNLVPDGLHSFLLLLPLLIISYILFFIYFLFNLLSSLVD